VIRVRDDGIGIGADLLRAFSISSPRRAGPRSRGSGTRHRPHPGAQPGGDARRPGRSAQRWSGGMAASWRCGLPLEFPEDGRLAALLVGSPPFTYYAWANRMSKDCMFKIVFSIRATWWSSTLARSSRGACRLIESRIWFSELAPRSWWIPTRKPAQRVRPGQAPVSAHARRPPGSKRGGARRNAPDAGGQGDEGTVRTFPMPVFPPSDPPLRRRVGGAMSIETLKIWRGCARSAGSWASQSRR